jgi:hypothetical protein
MVEATASAAQGVNGCPLRDNPVDRIARLSAKVAALIEATYGSSGESFRELNETMQDNYMWTVADLAGELHRTIYSHRWTAAPMRKTVSAEKLK